MPDNVQALLQSSSGLKALVVGLWFVLVFTGERFAAASPRPQSKRRLFRNLGLWAIVLIASPLIIAPMTAFGANHLLWIRPAALNESWLILAVDIVLLDCWTYCIHRAYHRVPAMWRLHKVHHFDEFLDSTSAFRFHLGEVALSAMLRLAPVILLAIPLSHVILFEIILVCGAVFHHSNLRLPPRFEKTLSWVIVTPSIHWVHHRAVMADTNSNYAAILSLWDRVFSSRSATMRTPTMKIGLESIEDKPLLRLILTPFLRSGG